MLQLFVLFYLLKLPALVAGIAGLAINYSAYEAEIYRAGLQAIPAGQMEAALALGMSRRVALRRVIVPQAVRIVISDFLFPHDPAALIRRLAGDASALWVIQLLNAWEADPARIPCPGGESGDDVAARVSSFLVDLLAAHDATPAADPSTERPVLAVAHSSLNRILVCVALGIAIREFRLRLQQSQANLTALRFEHGSGPGDARLILLNDLAHLRRPPKTPWE